MNTSTCVFDNIYLGGCNGLLSSSITHIISIGEEYQCSTPNTITTSFYECEDSSNTNIQPLLSIVTKQMNEIDKNGGIIYLHCTYGQSRSVTILLAYMIRYLGYTYTNAIAIIRSNREIGVNPSFVTQLMTWLDTNNISH